MVLSRVATAIWLIAFLLVSQNGEASEDARLQDAKLGGSSEACGERGAHEIRNGQSSKGNGKKP